MSGRRKFQLLLIACLLAVGAAIAVPIASGWSSDVPGPGSSIENPDYSGALIYIKDPAVGDTVMFEIDMPTITQGQSIEITSLTLGEGAPGLRLVGGRIYRRQDFDGFALLVWQTQNADSYDPHERPSTNLIGSPLQGQSDPERFIMFEFTVCEQGDHRVDAIDVTYEQGGETYRQTLRLAFEVRGARAGTPCS